MLLLLPLVFLILLVASSGFFQLVKCAEFIPFMRNLCFVLNVLIVVYTPRVCLIEVKLSYLILVFFLN